MKAHLKKRETDFQIISDWIEPNSKVLDLGCGHGILLEYLKCKKKIQGFGVDIDLDKIQSCVKRGVAAYMGDVENYIQLFEEGHFDWVICSRTLQELDNPGRIITQALRVGERLAVGFINHGYWLNRWALFSKGHRVVNEVYPKAWPDCDSYNPITVARFEEYCAENEIDIYDRVYLAGNWKTRINKLPDWRAGYALYVLRKR